MTDAAVIQAITRCHLRANIHQWEHDSRWRVRWDHATVDPGGTLFGPGPYLHVPVHCRVCGAVDAVVRVHAPARLRAKVAKQWVGAK